MPFFGRVNEDVYITGDKQLDKKLQELGTKLASKYLRRATREVAKHVLADAKAAVRVKSGKLKKSLKVRALPRKGRSKDQIGHTVTTGNRLFEGETFYGGFLEYGWAPMRGKRDTFGSQKSARRRTSYQLRKARRLGKTPPDLALPERNEGYPFLRPALYKDENLRLNLFVQEVRKFVNEENKG